MKVMGKTRGRAQRWMVGYKRVDDEDDGRTYAYCEP